MPANTWSRYHRRRRIERRVDACIRAFDLFSRSVVLIAGGYIAYIVVRGWF